MYNELKNIFVGICRGCTDRWCCGSCVDMNGYLDKDTFKNMKEKYDWSNKTGFLDPKIGCVISYEERSIICLEFVCKNIKLTDEQRNSVVNIIKNIKVKRSLQ